MIEYRESKEVQQFADLVELLAHIRKGHPEVTTIGLHSLRYGRHANGKPELVIGHFGDVVRVGDSTELGCCRRQ